MSPDPSFFTLTTVEVRMHETEKKTRGETQECCSQAIHEGTVYPHISLWQAQECRIHATNPRHKLAAAVAENTVKQAPATRRLGCGGRIIGNRNEFALDRKFDWTCPKNRLNRAAVRKLFLRFTVECF